MNGFIAVVSGSISGVFGGLAGVAIAAGQHRTAAVLGAVALIGIIGGWFATREESENG